MNRIEQMAQQQQLIEALGLAGLFMWAAIIVLVMSFLAMGVSTAMHIQKVRRLNELEARIRRRSLL
jgi:hypothetical protein